MNYDIILKAVKISKILDIHQKKTTLMIIAQNLSELSGQIQGPESQRPLYLNVKLEVTVFP